MHHPGKVSTTELEWDRVDWVRISTHVDTLGLGFGWNWICRELHISRFCKVLTNFEHFLHCRPAVDTSMLLFIHTD
jgi:hypothetical protein